MSDKISDALRAYACDEKDLFARAADVIEGQEDTISHLSNEISILEDSLDDLQGESHRFYTRSYTRKDLEGAITCGDKDHLQIVLDSIFGAP